MVKHQIVSKCYENDCGFTYSACRPFTKNKVRTQKFKETEDSKNELDKTCFQHDMAYGDFKDLTRRTGSDKILRDKAFSIAKNPKYYGYQRVFASMVHKFFHKNTSGGAIKNENMSKKISRTITQSNYQKIYEKKSTLIFYR